MRLELWVLHTLRARAGAKRRDATCASAQVKGYLQTCILLSTLSLRLLVPLIISWTMDVRQFVQSNISAMVANKIEAEHEAYRIKAPQNEKALGINHVLYQPEMIYTTKLWCTGTSLREAKDSDALRYRGLIEWRRRSPVGS